MIELNGVADIHSETTSSGLEIRVIKQNENEHNIERIGSE
jgi:hypothetical protein